jgi:catechol-2,3-dioxygenase
MLQTQSMYAYIPARDLERARQFYERKLGFRPTLESNGGVTYQCAGGTACFCTRRRMPGPRRPARRSGRSTMSSARSPS